MGFCRQEYWSGLPFPSPGNLSDPGITPRSPALQTGTLTSEPPGKPKRTVLLLYLCVKQHSPFETFHPLLEVPDPVFLPVPGDRNVLVDKPSAFSLFIP